ncbi:MAG TPA: DUF4148 domain-containing protein, partial [Rudaea sp.]
MSIMNGLFRTVVISSALALPAFALAQQTNGPVTREQVQNDLRQLEAAGYSPAAGENAQYPNDIQAAEARAQGAAQTGIGGATSGTSQSGRSMEPAPE